MRKTKKEKLAAVFRRQKEFERTKFVFRNPQKVEPETLEPTFQTEKVGFGEDDKLTNLTNLSYLPPQLVKIGIITAVLIGVQIILFLIL